MEDVQINALAIGPREPAPTAHAAAVVQDCPPVDAVTVPRCSAGPRSDSPPLRMRVPPNARLGSSKRQRVAATEVDETEPAVVAVPVAIVEPGAPSQPPQERPRYLSVAAAATETGLPKAVVKSWAAQGFMDTLKPGSDNSHRLVEMGDLLRFVALKRELARTDMRKKLEEEQAERLAADSKSSDEEEQRRDGPEHWCMCVWTRIWQIERQDLIATRKNSPRSRYTKSMCSCNSWGIRWDFPIEKRA